MPNFNINLDETLKARRIKHNDLAKVIGVNKSTISRWIKGDRVPSFETFIKLCQFLKIDPAGLIFDMTKGVKAKPQCGTKEYCNTCKMFKCRIIERNTQACNKCIRHYGCMNCLK